MFALMLRRWTFAGALLLLIGCEDGRTRTDPDAGMSCMPAPSACATDLGNEFPVDVVANIRDASDSGRGSCADASAGDSRDVAFQWTAPRAGTYEIATESDSFDTILYVRRGSCDGEEIACNDDVENGNINSHVTVELAACETIVIVVDGYWAESTGEARLTISARENICDDGIDDDGDGLVDCDDDDCRTQECIEDGAWPPAWADFEWRVLELTNERRAAGANCGGEVFGPADPLEMNAIIRIAARLHSKDMGEQDYFEHDSLDGRTFDQRMSMAGFSGPSPWGENIAAGQRTAEEVVEGWMNSPGHCRNIMEPAFRVIGIGYAEVEGSTFGTYWTQDFAAGH